MFKIKFTTPYNPNFYGWTFSAPGEFLEFMPVVKTKFNSAFKGADSREFIYDEPIIKRTVMFYLRLCYDRAGLEVEDGKTYRDLLPLSGMEWVHVIKLAHFLGDYSWSEEVDLPTLPEISDYYSLISGYEVGAEIANEWINDVFMCKCSMDYDTTMDWIDSMTEEEKNRFYTSCRFMYVRCRTIDEYMRFFHVERNDPYYQHHMNNGDFFLPSEASEEYRNHQIIYSDGPPKCTCESLCAEKWHRFITEAGDAARAIWDNCNREEIIRFSGVPARKRGAMSKKSFDDLSSYLITFARKPNPLNHIEDEHSAALYKKYELECGEDKDLAYYRYMTYITDKRRKIQREISRESAKKWKKGCASKTVRVI